jgi:hypothetical protein
MSYELFKRTAIRVEKPTLSLTPHGKIGLNSAAARILEEIGIEAVLLLWDKVSCKFALKAAPKTDVNAYKVSIQRNKSGGSLAAKAFLSHIGWSARQRVTLPAAWNEKEKMLEITLPKKYVSLEMSGVRTRKTKSNL